MPLIDKADELFWLLILDALSNYGYRLMRRAKYRAEYGHPLAAVDEARLERVRAASRYIAERIGAEGKIFR